MSEEVKGNEADLSNESIPNLRDALDKAGQKYSDLENQFGEVNAELRQYKAKEVFRNSGYSEKHAELYVKSNPEAEFTNEAIQEFVTSYDLKPSTGQQEVNEENLNQMSSVAEPPSSQVGEVGMADTGKMSKSEYKQLQSKDPTAAHEALIQGRVQFREDNVIADSLQN